MDEAFKDEMYKQARSLINEGHVVKLFIEDKINYDMLEHYHRLDSSYIKNSSEQIVENIDTLKLVAKYVNRAGLQITKVEKIS